MNLYCIYDRQTQSFNAPFSATMSKEAVLMLHQTLAIGDTILGESPADFSLYCVGEFDMSNGQVKSCQPYLVTEVAPIHQAYKDSLLASSMNELAK